MDIALSQDQRETIAGHLKILLASTFVFYLKTLNYHWNLKGKEFYSMHLLFQKQYEELAETMDEMAERVRALGVIVEGNMQVFKEKSLIEDETSHEQPLTEMIKKQVHDHETIIGFIRKHLSEVEGFKDGATADFLNKRLAVHEKMAWMLRSSM